MIFIFDCMTLQTSHNIVQLHDSVQYCLVVFAMKYEL